MQVIHMDLNKISKKNKGWLLLSGAKMKNPKIPVIGGAIIIVCGVFGLINGIIFLMADIIFTEYLFFLVMPWDAPTMSSLTLLGIWTLIFSPIAIYGGIRAIRREMFSYAILGGIAALVISSSMGFFILGLLGLILIIIAWDTFK